MPKDVKDFLGYEEGDIVTLSDIQTQMQYNTDQMDLRITGKRTYREPNNMFKLTCYLLDSPDVKLMFVVKEVGDVYDLFVYYLEEEGELYAASEGVPECPYLSLFKETDDLKDRIVAEREDQITWDKQGTTTFGVEVQDGGSTGGITSLAEYYTEDMNDGNDRCLIDWRGSKTKGFLEAWYGCIVQDHEVEIYKT